LYFAAAPLIHSPIRFSCNEQRSEPAVHPPCEERKKPPSTLRTRRWPIGGSLPTARADGEALEAPERRVVPRAGASSPLRRVPGHGGARGRPAVLGASRGVEPLRGGRAPAAAAAVPRRGWPAGRTRGHFRRAPAPGQDARFLRVGNLVQVRRGKFFCYHQIWCYCSGKQIYKLDFLYVCSVNIKK